MTSSCSKTRIPENFKFTLKIPFRTFRKYRPEYLEVETLLDLCCRVYDARSEPPFWNCTPEEIANLILADTGHPEYKEAFIKNEIDGKSVIFLEADKFPRISIRHFDIIKELTAKIRDLYNIQQDEFKRNTVLHFMWYKAKRTGPTAYYMTPSKYFRLVHIIPEEQACGRSYYKLLNHWNRIPSFMFWCPHIMIGANRRVNPMTGTTQRQNFHPKDHPYLLNNHALRIYHFPCGYEFPIGKDMQTNISKQEHDSGLIACD